MSLDADLLLAFTIFFFAGISKGALGIGLTMLTIPMLSSLVSIQDAIAISFFPMVVTNFWQMVRGGNLGIALRRFWPLLVVLIFSAWLGTLALVGWSAEIVSILMGGMVIAFALFSLARPTLSLGPRLELPVSIAAGAIGGFFGGMALISGPPIIMLLLALKLRKEEFIGAIGLLYFFGLLPAGVLLPYYGVLRTEHIVPGLLSLVPVLAGLLIGEWIRSRINQTLFRNLLLVSLLAIGLNLVRRGVF